MSQDHSQFDLPDTVMMGGLNNACHITFDLTVLSIFLRCQTYSHPERRFKTTSRVCLVKQRWLVSCHAPARGVGCMPTWLHYNLVRSQSVINLLIFLAGRFLVAVVSPGSMVRLREHLPANNLKSVFEA